MVEDEAAPAGERQRSIALVDDDRNILTTLLDRAAGRGLRDPRSIPTARRAQGADREPARPRGVRHQDAADGRDGAAPPAARDLDLPVIFLTSKDEEQDEEAGLAMGADDYIAKPFSQRLLLARIRAILRRSGPVREADPEEERTQPADGPLIERGRLSMDPSRHRVTWAGRPVSLTVTEFLILEALAQRPGVIKSRNQLMDAAYPDDVFVDDRTVDSHIKRLRRKFRSADPEFGAIETLVRRRLQLLRWLKRSARGGRFGGSRSAPRSPPASSRST
jgi:two-component system response regulator ChvI